MPQVRIVIADDHALVRQGFRKLLDERPDWVVVAEAADGRDAVRQTLELQPDVAILDIAMPQLNGIEATRQIVSQRPAVRVLILSMYLRDTYVHQALEAGARGYLLKTSVAEDLLTAVGQVARGDAFFSPAVASVMQDDQVRWLARQGVADRFDTLSTREREVFQLIAEGRSSKEIAALLGISPGTVDTHRTHVMEKLDLHSAVEICLYAVRRGVIS